MNILATTPPPERLDFTYVGTRKLKNGDWFIDAQGGLSLWKWGTESKYPHPVYAASVGQK